MDFIFRAMLSLKARIGKSLILLGIMLIVCIVILAGFGIQSATNGAAVLARQKLGATVTLSQNMEKEMEKRRSSMESGGFDKEVRKGITRVEVPVSYAEKLASIQYVKEYYLSNSTQANLGEGVSAVSVTNDSEENSNGMIPRDNDRIGMSFGDVSLLGVNDFSVSTEAKNGEYKILEGNYLTTDDLNSNNTLIESDFAKENNLSVGSTFKIKNSNDSTEYELKVVGIYQSTSEIDNRGFGNSSMLPYNKLIVPYTLVNTIKGADSKDKVDSIKFYLDDPSNVDKFIEEGQKTDIDFNTYALDGGSRQYEQMMKPIENIASFSKITLIVVTIFGGAVLALILMLSIRERTNEIGILMSLGEKRVKIIGQFLVESLCILVIAIGISVFAGNSISNMIGNKLLANEQSIEQDNGPQMMGGKAGMNSMMPNGNSFNRKSNVEQIEELNIEIKPKEFSQMVGLSTLVVILSTILPALKIMRINPKEILSKHS